MSQVAVLFLDDSLARHNGFIKMCQSQGWRPSHAYTVEEFKTLLAERAYDIIFLDHDLGDGVPDGKAAVRELIKVANDNRPNLVVVHSHNKPEAIRMCFDLSEAGFCVVRNKFRVA